MKSITNANQLTDADGGKVVEVLQERYDGRSRPHYVWQRGVFTKKEDERGRQNIVIITRYSSETHLSEYRIHTTRGENNLPNRTPHENQGIEGILPEAEAMRYRLTLQGVELERPLTKPELKALRLE